MPTAYSYIRFSTPAQADGDSLRRQIEPARAYAAEHGLALDESFRDLGVSAYTGKNVKVGALGRFRSRVDAGDVEPGSVLIVESLDRLSREQILDALAQFLALLSAGIEIVTLADGQRYTRESANDVGPLIISITSMARAHEESRIKSLRGKAAWQKKRTAAASKTPLSACCPAWLRLSDDRTCYETIPEAAAVVRQIYRDAERGMGQTAIAQKLNRAGVPNIARAKTWSESSVHGILVNRSVFGEFQPHTGHGSTRRPEGDPISDYYPAIMDENQFHRVQTARAQRRVAGGGRTGKRHNVLQKLAVCAECGAAMLYVDKRSKNQRARGGQPYLVCKSVHNGTGCSSKARPKYAALETAVLWGLRSADVSALVMGDVAAETASLRDEIAVIDGRLSAAQSTLTLWIDEFETGGNTETAATRIRALDTEIEELKQSRRLLRLKQKRAVASTTDARTTIDAIIALHERMRSLEGEERIVARAELSARLRDLVEQVECGQDEANVVYRSGSTESVTIRTVRKKRAA